MNLKAVRLTKTDTCLTYILKRLGLGENYCTYETYHEFFNQYNFYKVYKKLEKGDVFLWDKGMTWKWLAWAIDEAGTVEWKNIPVEFHFGIYEGNGQFSDCTRLVTPPHPTLRFRKIIDLQKNPDYVLRLI